MSDNLQSLRYIRETTGVDGFPDKGTIPGYETQSGTFSTNGRTLTGSSSSFLSELLPGDYLYSTTLHEIRRVQDVSRDNAGYLRQAFSSNVSGDNVNRVRPRYRVVSFEDVGSSPAIIQGDTLAAGTYDSINSNYGVEPITYDASGADQELKFQLGE